METVKVKVINEYYNGMIYGYQFHNGTAMVKVKDLDYLKQFGVFVADEPKEIKKENTKQPKKKVVK